MDLQTLRTMTGATTTTPGGGADGSYSGNFEASSELGSFIQDLMLRKQRMAEEAARQQTLLAQRDRNTRDKEAAQQRADAQGEQMQRSADAERAKQEALARQAREVKPVDQRYGLEGFRMYDSNKVPINPRS